jgi:hypothetical protein
MQAATGPLFFEWQTAFVSGDSVATTGSDSAVNEAEYRARSAHRRHASLARPSQITTSRKLKSVAFVIVLIVSMFAWVLTLGWAALKVAGLL